MWFPVLCNTFGFRATVSGVPPPPPACVLKEVICYCLCLLLLPVQPFLVCWCSDQSAITHQTDVRTWTGQTLCAEDTQPADSQFQLFTFWGWACRGPGGRGYQQ